MGRPLSETLSRLWVLLILASELCQGRVPISAPSFSSFRNGCSEIAPRSLPLRLTGGAARRGPPRRRMTRSAPCSWRRKRENKIQEKTPQRNPERVVAAWEGMILWRSRELQARLGMCLAPPPSRPEKKTDLNEANARAREREPERERESTSPRLRGGDGPQKSEPNTYPVRVVPAQSVKSQLMDQDKSAWSSKYGLYYARRKIKLAFFYFENSTFRISLCIFLNTNFSFITHSP